ncbi:MAG: hypothetical protein GXO62_00755 [Epsilonproteobacteria bacterium]|nr:hypothetical protein [Campylobacterota bacterium]
MKVEVKLLDEISSVPKDALLIAFSSEIDKIKEVYDKLKSLSENFVLATSDGEIYNWQITEDKTVVSVIEFENTEFKIFYNYEEDSFNMGKNLALKFEKKPEVMLAFSDAFHTNGEMLLKGIYSVFEDLTLSGGMAGDSSRFHKTYIATSEGLYEKGSIAIGLFNENLKVENISSLGWIPVGVEHIITKSDENVIYEIDNKPAIEFYKRYLGEELAKELPRIGIEFPLMIKRDEQFVARAVLQVLENGALKVGGNVKEGETVYIGIGFIEKILADHFEQLKESGYELFLVFSCMARKRFLGKDIAKETIPFANKAPTAGFFTYGEFYNKYFMNQTFTLCAIGEGECEENKRENEKNQIDPKDVYHLGLVNILNTLAKDFYEKDRQLKNIQKSLEIKTELINNVENIENIITFELDEKDLDDHDIKSIKLSKTDILNTLDSVNCYKLINFLKNPNSEDYIEIKSEDGKSYIVFAKRNDGKIYGVIVDISSIRKKDEMLISQSRLAQMGEMINMIAHQWRQPINAISATIIKLQLLREMGELSDEKLGESFDFISKTIQNISNTIDEFLNFSKPVSLCEEFSVEEVIENVMKLILVQLYNHNIQIEFEFDDFKIKSYKKEIEHIILNLLTNARDILDGKEGDKFIYLRAKKEGDTSYIEIEDNGGGIDLEPIERVFDPYFTTKENGTGLGLYLSKKIAREKLKGDLVVSNGKEGAIFKLIIKDICEEL